MSRVPLHFINSLVDLSWEDAMWGYKKGFINSDDLIEIAEETFFSESYDEKVFEVARLPRKSASELDLLISRVDINDGTHDESYEKWLYIILYWTFENRAVIDDPLGEVESIYADFDYPESIANLVRYMPIESSSVDNSPKGGEQYLYSKWKNYLDNVEKKYNRSEDSL